MPRQNLSHPTTRRRRTSALVALQLALCVVASAVAGPATSPAAPATRPSESNRPYVAAATFATKSARQAAAADERFIYAVDSTHIIRLDRATGRELGRSVGPAKHLNSAFLFDGKLYCAHSNYPRKPDQSDIRVLDPATMELRVFHTFENPAGSLTWAVRRAAASGDDAWWCHFAHYDDDNARSVLIRFDPAWKETGRWTYPPAMIGEWGRYSASGGIWAGDDLLVTGHDKRLVYRLRVPKEPGVVEWTETIATPFPGQGIATDPVTGGLVGIDRGRGMVVFAQVPTANPLE